MHWIVQNNMFSEEGFGKLLDALDRLDCKYSLVRVVPFSHEIQPEPQVDGPAFVMGTYTLVNTAIERGWKPGAFLNANFDYREQAKHWPMLNQHARYYRFGDVPEHYSLFFIRPVHDSKAFIGQVMDWPSFETWRKQVLALAPGESPLLDADTMVMVAPKKEIWTETRFWVVDGKVVTASGYKFGTLKRYSEGAAPSLIDFVEGLCRKWVPSRAFVVDIAHCLDGYSVVEVNCLNCAGFYKGDMQRLVAAIEEMPLDTDPNPS